MLQLLNMEITDKKLLSTFKGTSPISRKTIRTRLGNPSKRAINAVINSAVKRNIIRQVLPNEVGSGKYKIHVYQKITI